MKDIVVFTIADNKNKKWADGLKRSFLTFHPDIDFIIYDQEYIDVALREDPMFFYKATPWIGRILLEEYKKVIKIDADSVVTGDISHILNSDEYQVGTVLNYSKKDVATYGPVSVFNILPENYMNCGLVAMNDKSFVNHWWNLCNRPVFNSFRYREQDLLNVIYYYGNYRVKCFDHDGETLNGLAGKDYWHGFEMIDNQLVLPLYNPDTNKVEKTIKVKVIHWAGGNDPQKMNFATKFSPEVAHYLEKLTQYE